MSQNEDDEQGPPDCDHCDGAGQQPGTLMPAGPWEVRMIEDHPVVYAGEDLVCHVAILNVSDARLISAVPELLRALKACRAILYGGAAETAMTALRGTVDAAIAKAEGRAK